MSNSLHKQWLDELPEQQRAHHELQQHRFAAHLAKQAKARIQKWLDELPQRVEEYNNMGGLEGDNAMTVEDRMRCPEGSQPDFLMTLCDQIVENHENWTLPRLHRVLGYIEGCMIATGRTTPRAESHATLEAKFSFSEG